MKPIHVMRFKQATASGPTDPFFSSVTALLHFDGPNGSTTFTDQKGRVWTVNAPVALSNTQSKFGGTSGRFSGGYLQTGPSPDFAFGTDDFTIEMFAFATSNPSGSALIAEAYTGGSDAVQFTLGFCSTFPGSATGDRLFFGRYDGTTWAGTIAPGGFPVGQWVHVAGVRSGNTWTLYMDGVAVTSMTYTGSVAQEGDVYIGKRWDSAGSPYFDGFIDELRITKGVARYTANFSVPTAPFPNS